MNGSAPCTAQWGGTGQLSRRHFLTPASWRDAMAGHGDLESTAVEDSTVQLLINHRQWTQTGWVADVSLSQYPRAGRICSDAALYQRRWCQAWRVVRPAVAVSP